MIIGLGAGWARDPRSSLAGRKTRAMKGVDQGTPHRFTSVRSDESCRTRCRQRILSPSFGVWISTTLDILAFLPLDRPQTWPAGDLRDRNPSSPGLPRSSRRAA
jgi:hypothetical protein